jgi:NAD(P)H dehydrogenase (quinone)
VEAGLPYSDASAVEARPRGVAEDLDRALRGLDRRPTIPFNRMAEWGANGRILPEAPVHSPFIRRKQQLDLA